MGRNTGLFGAFSSIDAFGKTMDDVKIKTRTGALLTMLSLSIIFSLTMLEFIDYRRVHLEPSILVDRSRGEKLTVDLNITFPRVPCYLLSIDIMDISGEHQNDLTHDIDKHRLTKTGELIDLHSKGLKGDVEKVIEGRGKDYCGSCYGGVPPANGCCNNCEEVREAYVRKGWSFTNPDSIDQCVEEHWSDKIAAQNSEGCNVAGRVRVNKVVGNFHMSPGKSFQSNSMHVHDLVPYLRSGNHHDFGHVINRFSFGADMDPVEPTPRMLEVKKKLNSVNPLEGVRAHTEESNYMFQYFVKVVSTQFHSLTGEIIPSHQYSVTSYERDMSQGGQPAKDSHGHMTAHGMAGVPGVFFNYEISPMLVIHTETRQSFAHFLTSVAAIVGGVLTVFQLIDSAIFSGKRVLKGEKETSTAYNGKLL